MAARCFQGPEIKLCCLGHQQLMSRGGSRGQHAMHPVGWQGNLDDLHEQAEPPEDGSSAVKAVALPWAYWGECGHE